jgi:hypothetical protein
MFPRIVIAILILGAPLAAGEPKPAFVPLFNGRDLAGWTERQVAKGQEGRWQVENGILKARPGSGWLGTEKQYGDFILRVEWKIAVDGNSGIFFRVPAAPFTGSPSDAGFEIQILDDHGPKFKGKLKDYQYCGGLYHFQPIRKPVYKGPDTWQSYELTVRGDTIALVFNGEHVLQADISGNEAMQRRPKSGFIGLQNHGTAVEFRQIELAEFPR